jgi:glucose/arabinose dehydrogenase
MALTAPALPQRAPPVEPQLLRQNPPSLPVPPLRAEPYTFNTAEQNHLRVTLVAKLRHPFGMAFLPSGDALVVERGTALRVIHGMTGAHPQLDPNPVTGVPTEIQDVALHPNFATNHLVYFVYVKPGPADGSPQLRAGAVGRGKFDGKTVTDAQEIFTGGSSAAAVGLRRLLFGADGLLYITSASPFGQESGDLGSVYGKVLRVRDDGSVPPDNPFVNKPGARAEIYASGLRDAEGAVFHAASGQILATDHGPNGGDKINVIRAGGDYGWPRYSFGRQYDGSRVSELPIVKGIEQPLVLWIPSVAPSGLEVYTGDRFPAWRGNLFVGSAQRGEIRGTGGLERVVLNGNLEELRRESLLTDLHLRVRFVRQGPDGLLYVLVEGFGAAGGAGPDENSAVLRLEPAP